MTRLVMGVIAGVLLSSAPTFAEPQCMDGRTATAATQGRCCWPGQSWSAQYGRCDGAPTCPSGWAAHGDDCIKTTTVQASNACSHDADCPPGLVCDQKCVAPTLKSSCTWIGSFDSSLVPGPSASDVTEALRLIGSKAAISNLPLAMSGNVPNAMAAIWGHTRVIVYSPGFLQQLQSAAASNKTWAVRFVLAHELGHHLEGHTVGSAANQWEAEYQADAWAARILKRMGATEKEALAAMEAYVVPPSQTHPGSKQREANIKQAYSEGEPSPGDKPKPVGPPGGEDVDPKPTPNPVAYPVPQPIPQPQGMPSGSPIEPCACRWFPGYRGAAPVCASGVGIAVACPNLWCGPMAPMTAVFCQ